MDLKFWAEKRVFLTGHTGFKGGWISTRLDQMGALVSGYALPPSTDPSLWKYLKFSQGVRSELGDVRDYEKLKKAILDFDPQIIIHAAAQPLVFEGHKDPLNTFSTNILGTANILNVARECRNLKVFLNITTDKVYENSDLQNAFRESDRLGGNDPYAASKVCSEIITNSFRRSFLNNVKTATARAGNVIGGGDWSPYRLIPDLVRSLLKNEEILIRNPEAVRPWQHVLDSTNGYLSYIEYLWKADKNYEATMNFSPESKEVWTVREIINFLQKEFPETIIKTTYSSSENAFPDEANYLLLNTELAKKTLGWKCRWNISDSIKHTWEWYSRVNKGEDPMIVTNEQIRAYDK